MTTNQTNVYCSITGTTIVVNGIEGYYTFSKGHRKYYLCSLAYRMFAEICNEFNTSFCMVPKAALERASWIFVGDPEASLTGGEFLEQGMRYQDEKFRNTRI